MRRLMALLLPLWGVLVPAAGHAESNEASVGLTGGMLLPAFASRSPTDLALATWVAGIEVQYGVLDNLSLRAAFSATSFAAQALRTSVEDGRAYSGEHRFASAYYHPEVGARLKLLGGYNVAPYAEASLGYLWGVYTQTSVGFAPGAAERVRLRDQAQGNMTVGAGLALDYRLFNALFVGLAARYVMVLGESISRSYVSVPLMVSFYW